MLHYYTPQQRIFFLNYLLNLYFCKRISSNSIFICNLRYDMPFAPTRKPIPPPRPNFQKQNDCDSKPTYTHMLESMEPHNYARIRWPRYIIINPLTTLIYFIPDLHTRELEFSLLYSITLKQNVNS